MFLVPVVFCWSLCAWVLWVPYGLCPLSRLAPSSDWLPCLSASFCNWHLCFLFCAYFNDFPVWVCFSESLPIRPTAADRFYFCFWYWSATTMAGISRLPSVHYLIRFSLVVLIAFLDLSLSPLSSCLSLSLSLSLTALNTFFIYVPPFSLFSNSPQTPSLPTKQSIINN